MKTNRFTLFVAAVLSFAACSKVVPVETINEPSNLEPSVQEPVETITFSASIDQDSKATLSGLDINWVSGDYIGVATNAGTEIQKCAITVDPGNSKVCSFTVETVAGATTFYAIYTGASNFDGISFDPSTETFSGKAAGNLQVINEYYSATSVTAADLTMAGKTTTTSITMKPCLALVQIKIGSKSVESKYQTISETGYSGVRGWKIYQLGSGKYSAGDYTVNLSGSNPEVTPNSSLTRKDARTFSSGDLLSSSSTYYTCIIPGGSITGFQLDFLGFNSDETASWDPTYSMSLIKSVTVEPGDYFNFGTLDPLTAQKAKNDFTPAITIDGTMTDWSSVATAYDTKDTGTDTYIVQWKTTSDSRNIYFYYKIKKSSITYSSGSYNWGSYIQTYYDTNKDGNNNARSYVYPFKGSTEGTIEFKSGTTGAVEVPVGSKVGEFVSTNGCIDGDYAYVEIGISRALLGISASGKEIIVRHQMVSGGQTTSGQTITLK